MDSWTWKETVLFIPKVMEYTNEDALLLRWFINYEEIFPSFEAFKKALRSGAANQTKQVSEIETDADALMRLNWEEENGEWN